MSRFRRPAAHASGHDAAGAAFSELLDRHRKSLLRAATRMEGSRAAGEELLQGALARTWRRFDPAWDDTAFVGYVRVAMTNAQRSRWRRPLREDPAELIDRPAPLGTGEARVDDADELRRVLHRLPEPQRRVVVMRYYGDLSEQQTAQALSCSVGTVKSQTSRAVTRLRRLMESTREVANAVTGEFPAVRDLPTGEHPALL